MNEQPLPTEPSNLLTIGFVVLPLLLVTFWIWAVGLMVRNPLRARGLTSIGVATLLGATLLLGKQAFLHTFEAFPPPVLRVFLACFLLTLGIGCLSPGRRLAEAMPLWVLVGFQAFRLPLELLMARAYAEGIMPIEMSFHGRNFDVVTGLLAIPLSLALRRGHAGPKLVYLWNMLGLALLINVVATAVSLMPGPHGLSNAEIPNVWVSYWPFIWLPTVLVTSAQLGHILVFRRLRLDRRHARGLVP